MVANQEIQRVRRRADRKFHDGIVKYVFENPDYLDIEGLSSDTVIWKAREYRYMHGRGHKEKGKYEIFPAPDLVFLYYQANGLNFLVLEVKGSILGKSHIEAERQLNRAESYFRGFWKAVIVNQVKPALLNRLEEFLYTDVFLSLAEVTREPLIPEYMVMPYKTGIYLGKMRTMCGTGQTYFTE
ncbi:hypothetical protein ACFLXO_08750 [Chloroflexota bacterium]